MSTCSICKRELDQPGMRDTEDCGGDCLRCMALYGDDDDCRHALVQAFAADFKTLVRRYFNNSDDTDMIMRCQDKTSMYTPWIWANHD